MIGEITIRQCVYSTKCHFDESTFRRNGSLDKVSFDEVSYTHLKCNPQPLKIYIMDFTSIITVLDLIRALYIVHNLKKIYSLFWKQPRSRFADVICW